MTDGISSMILLSYYCAMSQQRCFLPGRSNTEHRYCGVSEQGSLTHLMPACTGILSKNFRAQRPDQRDTCAEERGTSSVRAPVTSGYTLQSIDVRECPRRSTNAKCRLFFLKVIVGSYSVAYGNCCGSF